MNVIDAGVIVGLLTGDFSVDALGEEELGAPHLIDSEVTNALRRLVAAGSLTDAEGGVAMQGFAQISLTRFPADWLRPRMWALRQNLTAYDATYVALAELIGATGLLTTDAHLATAPGVACAVQVL